MENSESMQGCIFGRRVIWSAQLAVMKPRCESIFANKKVGIRDRGNCSSNVNHKPSPSGA